MRQQSLWLSCLVGLGLAASFASGQPAAPSAPAVKLMPCPDGKPVFDHTRIDRSLKEPAYGSEKPLYRFFAFGPEGKTVMAMVADESKGAGSGADTLYVDLNANHDLTEPGEKFTYDKPRPPAKPVKSQQGDLFAFSVTDWGKAILPETSLDVPDEVFKYRLTVTSGFVHILISTRDGTWKAPLRLMDDIPWSQSRQAAPVFRVGGNDFHLKSENFLEVPKGRGTAFENGLGAKVRPGAKFSVDGTAPFFAGSSPSAYLGWFYVEGGHPSLRAWIESAADPSQPVAAEIILRGY
jgi:hypothetical protein